MGKVKLFLSALLLTFVGFFAVLATPSPVYAEDACDVAGYYDPLICGERHKDEETEVLARVKNILNTVYLWVGIISVIVIVIGGINFMTSSGEATKINTAKRTIIYATIGLVIALAAFAITSFFISALDGKTKPDPDAGQQADPNDPERLKVRSISVTSSIRLMAGQSVQLHPRVIPDYAANQTLTFESKNPAVATVDEKGVIQTFSDGEAIIVVASPDGISKEVKVTVEKPVEVKAIKLSKSSIKIKTGTTTTISASVMPANAADKTIAWESANPKIAFITQSGLVRGVKVGKTKINVYARNKTSVAFTPYPTNAELTNPISLEEVKKSPTVVKAYISVEVVQNTTPGTGTVSEGGPALVAAVPSTERNYSKSLNYTAETQKIVKAHKSDFNCSNFESYMKNHGGYTAYVKSLGGYFTAYASKKPKVVTAADFQAVGEYVYGLWSIWGPDYNSWFKSKCGPCHYVNWNTSDAFYSKCPNKRGNSFGQSHIKAYASGSKTIDGNLKTSKNVRTHCNGSVDIFVQTLGLPWKGAASGAKKRHNNKKITKVKDLQVGDIIAMSGHWAIVGEVYKDYLVTYDGGSHFTKNGRHTFKKMFKRSSSYIYKKDWVGVRQWNIDQTKTLEGLK